MRISFDTAHLHHCSCSEMQKNKEGSGYRALFSFDLTWKIKDKDAADPRQLKDNGVFLASG